MPREGHDITSLAKFPTLTPFQSTCPARGTTAERYIVLRSMEFQSTCPARGTTAARWLRCVMIAISIHVPREGHDRDRRNSRSPPRDFNPRAPRGARRLLSAHTGRGKHFNPRAPRGARPQRPRQCSPRPRDFNPRAPRGARHICMQGRHVRLAISIHVPREGHDAVLGLHARRRTAFQSTCPARGTTLAESRALPVLPISIHVPREGHDAGGRGGGRQRSISIHVPQPDSHAWMA